MRDYRFHGFNPAGAAGLAAALSEDGYVVLSVAPAANAAADGWTVEARGEAVSEGLLEVLAQFYGGRYEGEGMSFA